MKQIMNACGIVLTRHTYYRVVHDLWRALPPPVSDHPDDLVCRDNAAMAEVASLLPADPAEVALAGQFVAACAHAMDCLRLVNVHAAEPAIAMKCRAQAASMMRQACMARSMLLRIQEARWKRAENYTNEPAWSDHGILDRMAEALGGAPAHAANAGTQGATVPGRTEQALNISGAHPSAASARTDARAGDVPPTQIVSINDTNSEKTANETHARLGSPASPIDDTPDSLPGSYAVSWPPHHPNERLEALSGRIPVSFAPSKWNLPAQDVVTDTMNRTPHPAGTMPTAA